MSFVKPSRSFYIDNLSLKRSLIRPLSVHVFSPFLSQMTWTVAPGDGGKVLPMLRIALSEQT